MKIPYPGAAGQAHAPLLCPGAGGMKFLLHEVTVMIIYKHRKNHLCIEVHVTTIGPGDILRWGYLFYLDECTTAVRGT